jgi:hypothetical protein
MRTALRKRLPFSCPALDGCSLTKTIALQFERGRIKSPEKNMLGTGRSARVVSDNK